MTMLKSVEERLRPKPATVSYAGPPPPSRKPPPELEPEPTTVLGDRRTGNASKLFGE